MSDLSNFTTYKENAGMFAGIEVLTPLAGSGSLLLHRNGQAFRRINLARAIAPRAFTSGRARFLVGGKTLISADQIGFAFQQSQEDLTGAAGAAYVAYLALGAGGVNSSIQLDRCSAGLPTRTSLGSGSTFTISANQAVAVEVTWIVDLTTLGGIRITVKHGTAVDFSSLTTDIDVVSTSTVLQTSVSEGPFMQHNLTTSSGQYLADSFDVLPLLVGT